MISKLLKKFCALFQGTRLNVASKVIEFKGPQWLVLPDEDTASYTNFGDGRPGDATELVVKVNTDPVLGAGHGDWRLPTIDELKGLNGTEAAPKGGRFWSSSPDAYDSGYAWYVYFDVGYVSYGNENVAARVRLVRSGQ